MSEEVTKKKSGVGDYIFPWISIVCATAIFYGSQFLSAIIMVIFHVNIEKSEGLFALVYSVIAIAALGVFAFFSKNFYSDKKSGVSFKKPELIKTLLVIMIAFGLLGCVTSYMIAVNTIAEHAKGGVVEEELEKYSESVDRYSEVEADEVSKSDKIFYYVAVVLLVPLTEELFFRGLILGPLLKKYHGAIGVIVSAIIFGLAHGISIHIGYAFMSGIIIGSVYCFTRNLGYTYIIHMIFNFFGSVLHMIMNDGWFTLSEKVTNTINSYVYLLEFFMIIPCFVALIILYVRYKRQRQEELKSKIKITEAPAEA